MAGESVPVIPEVLGHKARECMPYIMQAFIKKPDEVEKGLPFDRMLYIARREFEQSNDNTYVVSMSSRTIVYKGMFLVGQLRTSSATFRTRITSLPSQWYIPFQYQHKPKLGESSSKSFHGTQWRNQYHPW